MSVLYGMARVYWIFVTKLMGGVNFGLQSRSGDENCYRRTLSICLKLRISIAVDQTVSVHIAIFIVDFHGRRIYQMNVFHRDVLLLWNIFAFLNFTKILMLKNLTVRWLIEKRTLLEGKKPLLIIKGL